MSFPAALGPKALPATPVQHLGQTDSDVFRHVIYRAEVWGAGFSCPYQRMTTRAGSLARTTENLGLQQWSIVVQQSWLALAVQRSPEHPRVEHTNCCRHSHCQGLTAQWITHRQPFPTSRPDNKEGTEAAMVLEGTWSGPGCTFLRVQKRSGKSSRSIQCSACLGSSRCKVSQTDLL